MAHLYGLARLGRDAELRVIKSSGDTVADLSLAFSYGRKGEDGKKPTQWVNGSMWGKRAESLAPYLLKGGLVMVTLEDVHIEEYTKQDGSTASKLVGRVLDVQLAGGGDSDARSNSPLVQQAEPRKTAAKKAPSSFDDMDSDIPF
jgi:single-strand DNA-binding protein